MSLLLRHIPGEWDGTFTVLVRELARDLLLDGPVEITVNNEARLRSLAGYDAAADALIFEGNETIDVDDISEVQL